MANLFGIGVPAISKQLSNIFDEGRLEKNKLISKMETTTLHGAIEGKPQTSITNFYNLNVVIAVGFRVNSHKATRFFQWATKVLKEFMIKGVALDDDYLKQGSNLLDKDYLKEFVLFAQVKGEYFTEVGIVYGNVKSVITTKKLQSLI